jgi:tRNA dimethylallyltransferase
MKLTGASAVVDVHENEVLVICGPTAAGKSAVAMWLAENAPIAVVSADSRQVYRGFDVGTAKPTRDEQAHVPHFGIDVAAPTTRYSAAAWAESALGWIDRARDDARIPIVVGGTGLYLRALFEGLFEEPPLDATSRASLASYFHDFDLNELQRWANALDPARAHLGRTQLLRAIEIALLTGKRLSDLHRERPAQSRWGAARGLRPRYLLVDAPGQLESRIRNRVEAMEADGWSDEVRALMQTVPADAPAWNSTGYDAIRRTVLGEITRDKAHEIVLIATRQYAKRQRTWFRHQLPADGVTRLDSTRDDWRDAALAWAALDRTQVGSEGRNPV